MIKKEKLSARELGAAKWIKPFISAKEFLHGIRRWCLWLANASPTELKVLPKMLERVQGVRRFRASSKKQKTLEQANIPTLFAEISQSKTHYLPVHVTHRGNALNFVRISSARDYHWR
jgi:hypothetical protein